MPPLAAIDHIHVLVTDREAAKAWYRLVLGLQPVSSLASWASNGGPLMVGDPSGAVTLALFEEEPLPTRSTIAFRVDASGFIRWQEHLAEALKGAPRLVDHEVAWSLYFNDPFGNPFEITTYDYDALIGVATEVQSRPSCFE